MPGLRDIARRVGSGEASAEATVAAALARIADLNPALNAFVHVDSEAALAAARAVDRRIAGGEKLPLAGVPVGVKDTIWAADQVVAQGSRLFAGFRPPRDAIAVARLRQAGAVVVGMTNAPEFASKGHTNSPLHGASRHPADTRLTAGGSSGGSAVAVAAGMVPLALGTDAGGSIRRPAAHVGICGFKPTYGAIPCGPGFAEPPLGVSVVGPMASTVDDIEAAFEVLCGPDRRDPDSVPIMPAAATAAPLRIAWSPRFGLDVPMDAGVAAIMEETIGRLHSAGLRIDRRDPVWPAGISEAGLMAMHFAGLAAIHGDAWRRSPDRFDPEVGAQVERGFEVSALDVAKGRLASLALIETMDRFFDTADILIGPTTPCTAWPVDEPAPAMIGGVPVPLRGHAVFTPFFNHARTPALSLPCPVADGGLPVGLQVVAARGNDRALLAFAKQVEAILWGRDPRVV